VQWHPWTPLKWALSCAEVEFCSSLKHIQKLSLTTFFNSTKFLVDVTETHPMLDGQTWRLKCWCIFVTAFLYRKLFVNLNTAFRREQGPIVIPAEPKKEPPKQGYSVYGSPDINYSALYTSQPSVSSSKNGQKKSLPLPHVPLFQQAKKKISPKELATSGRENPYLAFQR